METKNKIEYDEQGVTCHIVEPTEKAAQVKDAIIRSMRLADVKPEEVLPVLGEAVIEFLIVIAKACNVDELELIRSFGEGIYTAQVELKEIKNSRHHEES